MLIKVKALHGDVLRARDGMIGSVDEVLFDDEQWTVRCLIVDTGGWLHGRKVLIAPAALGALDRERHTLDVNLTRDQVEGSPSAETDRPVSRQWEADYYDYYAWPYYWDGMGGMAGGMAGGMGVAGATWNPGALLASADGADWASQRAAEQRARDHEAARDHDDIHLRSTKAVTNYGVSALDGHLGHIEDFIVDDETWRIRYLAVDTRDWWPGKKVLLPPAWIEEVNWPDATVTVGVTRAQVQNGPEWDAGEPIRPAFEAELSAYYARQRPAASESQADRMEALAGPARRTPMAGQQARVTGPQGKRNEQEISQ